MTDNKLRHRTVAVAVIHDSRHGFLLWNNKRWGGYALPMKQIDAGADPARTALQAIQDRDFPLELPGASATALEQTGWFGHSGAGQGETYYDYHVFEIDPGRSLEPTELDPDLRFFANGELQAAANVTESTRAIATSMVEHQEVVAAIICREVEGELQLLLVHKPNHGYFFPAIRRKTHAPLEQMAIQATRFDTAYDGELTAEYCGEVTHQRAGTRFGASQRHYRFYLCCAASPGVDRCEPDNAWEQSLAAFESAQASAGRAFGDRGYWNWFTVGEIEKGTDMSADMPAVLPRAIECARKCLSKTSQT